MSRRSFGPTVLAGLAGAALASVAGHQPWAAVRVSGEADRAMADVALTGGSDGYPVAGALGLVALAAWGVLLVTRGGVRRALAALATLAAAGVLVAAAVGFAAVPDAVHEALADAALDGAEVTGTWWWGLTVLGAVVATGAGAVGFLRAPSWPEMGRKYDAPATGAGTTPRSAGADEGDLWRSLDSGHDPTA